MEKMMKQLSQLLLVMMMCPTVGVAQEWTDVTDKFMATTSFGEGYAGWNVEQSAQTWGTTQGCMRFFNGTFNFYQQLSNLPKGTYRLSVQGFYRQSSQPEAYSAYQNGLASITAYLYAGESSQPLRNLYEESFSEDVGNCYTPDNVLFYPDGSAAAATAFNSGMYQNEPLQFDAEGNVTVGIQCYENQGSNWCVFNNFKLEHLGDLPETPDEPDDPDDPDDPDEPDEPDDPDDPSDPVDPSEWVDLTTVLITNPGFADDSTDGWQWSSDASSQTSRAGCMEFWNGTFDFWQDLTGLPEGTYRLSVQSYYRAGNNDNTYNAYLNGTENLTAVLYAGDKTQTLKSVYSYELPEWVDGCWTYYSGGWWGGQPHYFPNTMESAAVAFGNGAYWNELVFKGSGDLRIGLRNSTWRQNNWCIFDNFTLKYYGTDADGLVLAQQQDVYKTLLAEAKRTRQKMGTDERAALTAAINADKDLDKENLSDLNAAIAALRPVLAAAKTSVTLYAEAKPVIKEIRETLAKTNVYTNEAYFTFMEDFTPYRERYDNGTFTSEDLTYLTYEVMPHNKGWHKANTIDDLLLSAWSIGEAKAKDYDTSLYINTWSVEGDTDGTGFTTPFYEYWTDDANKLGAAELTNTISDLEPGVYNVTLWGRVRLQNGQEAPAENGITLLVNDNEAQMADLTGGTQVGEGQFYIGEFTATGEVGEDRALTIKIKVNDDNNISWLSFKNVKFLFDAAKTQQNDDADQLKNAKADLEALIASINNMGLGKYTNETATNAENAAANAAAALEGDNLTLADISEQKSLLNKALQALEIREQSSALYAVQVGETHTSAETVEVTAQDNDEVVAYLTFGVEGGNDFKAGQANTYVDGYVAFTAGNGDNGGIDRGTVYFIKPVYDGVIEVSVALNGGKAFYIAEDGVNKEAFNGDKVTEKYYGPALFNVERNKTYAIWCAGSKLGFYGFNYDFGQGIAPIDETQLSIVTRLNGVTMDFSNGAVYNLNGQKMDNTGNLRPGLYIINGKKVVKK